MSETEIDAERQLASLLTACGAGNKDAFRRIYELQSARLYGIALRITRQPTLAADAVHDALLQVWRRAEKFDGHRGAAGAWLASLARYRAIDLVRKTSREVESADPAEEADDAPGPFDLLAADMEAARLRRCLDGLDETQRRAILLAFVKGLSHGELAERMAAPLGTVKSWVRRGLLALKVCLQS